MNRRNLLSRILAIGGGTASALIAASGKGVAASHAAMDHSKMDHSKMNKTGAMKGHAAHSHGSMMTMGDVGTDINEFDPSLLITDWDAGEVTQTADGRTLRTWYIDAVDREIEIAPGVTFPAWTFNGRVPGPTLRATEGDKLRIVFTNSGSHHHSLHFHGIHAAGMDGSADGNGLIAPGEKFVYEFDAYPFGCHLYHCHALPLKRHMHKGMYGGFIVDPNPDLHDEHKEVAKSRLLGSPENEQWQEFIMVMNGFDTNFDEENEIYALNTVANHYSNHPIKVDKSRPIRCYVINVTEFDPINSFHLHANFFNYFDHGTTLTPTLNTVDTIMQCQAQRGIIEMSFADHPPGKYMFHAHQAEFAELGWMALFDVVEG